MYTSFMGIYVKPGQAGHMEKELASMAEVVEMYEMSGPFDLLIKVMAGSRRDIEVLAGNILQLEGVEKTFNMLSLGEKFADKASDTPMTAFIGLGIEAGKERAVEMALFSGGNILVIYDMIYPYGLFIKVGYENERDVTTISDRALQIEGVRACDVFVVIRQIKH